MIKHRFIVGVIILIACSISAYLYHVHKKNASSKSGEREKEIILFKGAYDVKLIRINERVVKGHKLIYFINYIPTEIDIERLKNRNYANGLEYWKMMTVEGDVDYYDCWIPVPIDSEERLLDVFKDLRDKLGANIPIEKIAYKSRMFILNDKSKSQMYNYGLLCVYLKSQEGKGICGASLLIHDYTSPEDVYKQRKKSMKE
jgi:hypothetical protein